MQIHVHVAFTCSYVQCTCICYYILAVSLGSCWCSTSDTKQSVSVLTEAEETDLI